MENVPENLGESSGPKRDSAGRLLPGHGSLNPKGRPKGKSLKEFAREYLMGLSDGEKEKYIKELPPEIVWRMAEGNPHQSNDMVADVTLAKPLLDALVKDKPEETSTPDPSA